MKHIEIAALALLVAAQYSRAEGPIRLKARTIHPAGNGIRAVAVARRSHYILQFKAYPGPEIRQELARRQVRVLGYVPENGLMVSSGSDVDLNGLDVSWAGGLTASDKLSPLLAEPAPAYLAIFHSDVAMDEARVLAARSGFTVLEHGGLLPGQLLLAGGPGVLERLAARDEVSYVIPAPPELAAGEKLLACAGAFTEAGRVAEYAAVGRGWPKDATGTARLKYVLESYTARLGEAAVREEIERAFREWARYGNVTFDSGSSARSNATVAVSFARRNHGDGYAFDGPGRVLAHTFYPAPPNSEPIAGDMHFDVEENWNIGSDTDLFSVALHEAGHALGLGHSDRPGSVMYPYYRAASGLTADDIAGIRGLYGSAVEAPSEPEDPPSEPENPPSEPEHPPSGPVDPPVTPPVTPPPDEPAQPPATRDATPPSVRIQSPGFTIAATSSATIAVSGTASDNTGVAAVRWATSTGAAGTALGTANWSAQIPLLVGTNAVTIRAYDLAGNSGWRTITVVRR